MAIQTNITPAMAVKNWLSMPHGELVDVRRSGNRLFSCNESWAAGFFVKAIDGGKLRPLSSGIFRRGVSGIFYDTTDPEHAVWNTDVENYVRGVYHFGNFEKTSLGFHIPVIPDRLEDARFINPAAVQALCSWARTPWDKENPPAIMGRGLFTVSKFISGKGWPDPSEMRDEFWQVAIGCGIGDFAIIPYEIVDKLAAFVNPDLPYEKQGMWFASDECGGVFFDETGRFIAYNWDQNTYENLRNSPMFERDWTIATRNGLTPVQENEDESDDSTRLVNVDYLLENRIAGPLYDAGISDFSCRFYTSHENSTWQHKAWCGEGWQNKQCAGDRLPFQWRAICREYC